MGLSLAIRWRLGIEESSIKLWKRLNLKLIIATNKNKHQH
jgi:hypothetical protein